MPTDEPTAELATTHEPPKPLSLIAAAIAKGIDPEKLERLLDLQERYERNQAELAFNAAMRTAQERIPVVVKDAKNTHTGKKYATLETVLLTAKPIYSELGFSLCFTEEESKLPGHVRIVCEVSHTGGCSRRYGSDFPMDGAGSKGNANMSTIQAKGSTITYAKRYLVQMIFNIVIADQDLDGNAEGNCVNKAQYAELQTAINACAAAGKPVNIPGFLKWLNIETMDQLPQRDLAKALFELERKVKEAKK